MLEHWPKVLGEEATIKRLLTDHLSLCRLGDGELKLIRGQDYVRERANNALGEELRAILAAPDPRVLVGIPTMDKRSPKYTNWRQRQSAFLPYLSPDVSYVSAFISRPDSAPWISTETYAESVQALWQGKKVALVCEPDNKLVKVIPSAARKVWHIPCPSHGAYAYIDAYESQIVRGRPDIAILAHGVSATCLAHRLACRDIQAIDLGSIGGFLARMLYLEKLPHVFPAVLRHPDCENGTALRARLEAAGFQVFYCGEKGSDVC
jgi:hypothetical protein